VGSEEGKAGGVGWRREDSSSGGNPAIGERCSQGRMTWPEPFSGGGTRKEGGKLAARLMSCSAKVNQISYRGRETGSLPGMEEKMRGGAGKSGRSKVYQMSKENRKS